MPDWGKLPLELELSLNLWSLGLRPLPMESAVPFWDSLQAELQGEVVLVLGLDKDLKHSVAGFGLPAEAVLCPVFGGVFDFLFARDPGG